MKRRKKGEKVMNFFEWINDAKVGTWGKIAFFFSSYRETYISDLKQL